MERRILEPHEIFLGTYDEMFKPFFEKMDAFERKTKSAEHTAEKGEEKDADLRRDA